MSDVVLVHGTTQTTAGFWRLVESLEHLGHRVLTVDVPGGTASALDCAEAVAAQLPAGVECPVVAAHSASGLVLPALDRAALSRAR